MNHILVIMHLFSHSTVSRMGKRTVHCKYSLHIHMFCYIEFNGTHCTQHSMYLPHRKSYHFNRLTSGFFSKSSSHFKTFPTFYTRLRNTFNFVFRCFLMWCMSYSEIWFWGYNDRKSHDREQRQDCPLFCKHCDPRILFCSSYFTFIFKLLFYLHFSFLISESSVNRTLCTLYSGFDIRQIIIIILRNNVLQFDILRE